VSKACPCGRARPYAACCGPLHDGAPAGDAEALMRSRYTAYVMGLGDYLRRSWHPDTRPADLSLDGPAPTWLGLDVKRHEVLDEDHAIVEFVARSRVGGGAAQRMHETSRFVREHGHWYYLDGE
jgi:SEC-C motif-containing protein